MGKRAFILGNGSSLAGVNLDLLIGETTFACNRIHQKYPEFEWRPTYYVMVDKSCNREWPKDMYFHLDADETCYISDDMLKECRGFRGPDGNRYVFEKD